MPLVQKCPIWKPETLSALIRGATLFLLFSGIQVLASSGHIFLIPGTGNSLMGQYFCDSIVQKFESKGYTVKIPRNLSPLGGYRLNAQLVSDYLNQNCHSNLNWVVAHSAGGLYALGALKASTCPLRGLTTIGSPLRGAVLAKSISETYFSSVFQWFVDIYPSDAKVFADYLPEKTDEFLREIQPLKSSIKIYAIAGAQPRPEAFLDKWDAEYLMPHLDFLSRYMTEKNDGMVTVSSALGVGLSFKTNSGKQIQVNAVSEVFALDHLEQFQNVAIVNFFHKNISHVQNQQNLLYDTVLSLVEAP